MNYDVVVVGAGLAGMFAGALAARAGAQTLVTARGHGGLHVGTGCVDVWGYSHTEAAGRRVVNDPGAALGALQEGGHPLALAGAGAMAAGLRALQAMAAEASYPLEGDLRRNHWLPTALGVGRPTCLAPESFLRGDLWRSEAMVLGDLVGFRDFQAHLAAANLRRNGWAARAVRLELPRLPVRREMFATDLARLMDQPGYREEVAERWRPMLHGVSRLGLPALLGLKTPHEAWHDLSDRLGVAVFEIPIVPPSVPGMRLFSVLQGALEAAGGRVILGPGARGWVEAGRARGVVLATAGGDRRCEARQIILATGGFRHGGLVAARPGQARESVFELPVQIGPEWFAPLYWDDHPYARFGVRVNASMQPVDEGGRTMYENVYGVGGLAAGADRNSEGCREGVDLATAWKAVEQMGLGIAGDGRR